MSGKRILVIEQEHPADLAVFVDALHREALEVEVMTAATEEEARALCPHATALVAKAHSISAAVVATTPDLDWVQALTTGTDHLAKVNLPRHVVVTSVRGVHGPQMSELAFLLMLAFQRDIRTVLRDQARSTWARRPQRLLFGKTVVVVGVGAISEALAHRCQAFGMTTVGVSSTPRTASGFDQVVGRDRLTEAAGKADFLIVVAPYSPSTHHLVDASVLAAMPAHGVLINIARGNVCDEAAVFAALRERRIAGAGLDVFSREPLAADHPFWAMENVILTPHIGGMSDTYAQQTLPIVIENLRRYCVEDFAGMLNVVDRSSVAT